MSIFAIAVICLLVGALAGLIVFFVYGIIDSSTCRFVNGTPWLVAGVILSVLVWIGGIFVGVAINEENERIFITRYEAQKEVIESSLESEVLTGFERMELVKQASELNGELAQRKTKYDIWHYVTYDNGLFDDVEPIELK